MTKLFKFWRNESEDQAAAMVIACVVAINLFLDQFGIVYDAWGQTVVSFSDGKDVIWNVGEMVGCLLVAVKAKPVVDAGGGLIASLRRGWSTL